MMSEPFSALSPHVKDLVRHGIWSMYALQDDPSRFVLCSNHQLWVVRKDGSWDVEENAKVLVRDGRGCIDIKASLATLHDRLGDPVVLT